MMKIPLFTIVIANYNYGRFIGDALRSVLTQSLKDFELIVVDGASTDNSLEVVKSYAGDELYAMQTCDGKGIHEWHVCQNLTWLSEKDQGQSDAFNKGFTFAHGKFLTWLNADDLFSDDALISIAKEIYKNPSSEWFVGSTTWVDEHLRIIRVFRAHRFSHLRAKYGFLSADGPSSFFTKALYCRAGGVDENLHYVMDIDLWNKFYFKCSACFRRTTNCVWIFRIHKDSKLSGADVSASQKAIENRNKARNESKLIWHRYGKRKGMASWVCHLVTTSFWDHVITWFLNRHLVGREIRK